MYDSEKSSSEVSKNADFNLPLKRRRDKSYKIPSGAVLYTCFTSDFFLPATDEWRREAWAMIRERSDVHFVIFTKRIDRFHVSLPEDWGSAYENVTIGCTVENQERANYRLPIFNTLPLRHKLIIVAPMLEGMNIEAYLNESIEEVSVGGESGAQARALHFDWVLELRRQCEKYAIPFRFHQTGAKFVKDGKYYYIKRKFQHSQARKAGVDFRVEAENYGR
jgi:protein gp37